MKVFARILLLSLWLFAIVAPSAITLMDIDNPVIVTNLNEEEQQETGKKSPLQEKFVNDSSSNFSLIALSQKSLLGVYHPIGHVNFTQKILLPPPEHIS
ncbi:MAG: hypothetical protein RIM68_09240 [Arenibacter sp.]